MIVQLFGKDIAKVLTIFCISPGSRFQRKELKEKTRLNNLVLDRILNVLLNSRVIKREKRWLLLNIENKEARQVIELISKDYKELKEIPLDVYFPIIELIYLLGRLRGLDVYLFGSYAKLIFKENSDIDIAIVSEHISVKEKREVSNLTRKVKDRYDKILEIHYFTKSFHKNKKDPLVKDIIKNGVKLI
ncbi:MAG: nucleotidyltransferase domain-containing protein [Nanoarchaeota archaeon]|nr:nucleotidyltransferase domain-containing protein [Nanoarchaeota archaeon]